MASPQARQHVKPLPFRLCRAFLVGMKNELARIGHLTHGMLGYQVAFDKDLIEVTYRTLTLENPCRSFSLR